jgi:hypothetical protein
MGQLYQAKLADIQADLSYRTNLASSVMQYATSAQQTILNGKIADMQQASAVAQSNLSFQRQLQMQALEFGQNGLLAGIAAVDPKSPNFEQEMAAYTAQLRKPVATTATKRDTQVVDGKLVDMQTGEIITDFSGAGTRTAAEAEKTFSNINFLQTTVTDALTLTDSSSPTSTGEFLRKSIYGSATGAAQLQNKLDTLKVNMLTLMGDKDVKEFFGPQMSDNDSRLMLGAGTTADAYTNTPEGNRQELMRYGDLLNRMQTAVADGLKQQYASQTYGGPTAVGGDGKLYVIIDEPQ